MIAFERLCVTLRSSGKWLIISMMNSKRVIFPRYFFKRAIVIFINYAKIILLFTSLPWNIHINGNNQTVTLCLMLMKFDNLAKIETFLPAFLHNEETYSLNFRFLSVCKPSTFCLLLSQMVSCLAFHVPVFLSRS